MKYACVLAALAAAAPLRAGMPNADCSHPFVFRDARVNVIVLPYRNKDAASPDLERAGSQLTLLLQQTILFSALKFPSIGTVRMVAQNPSQVADCQTSLVAPKILGQAPGAAQQLSPDGAAILLWGQIYKEGDQIYLCSYARLVKRGTDVAMESSGGGHGIFSARLPADGMTFPARTITTGLLEEVGRIFRKSATAHRERSLTSPGFDLPMDPRNPFAYQVVEATTDGWMHVRSAEGGMSGWIYANETLRSQTLARTLPELRFVDGAIGYLEFAKGANPAGILAHARPSLESFAEVGNPSTSLATATAKSMLAVMFQRDASLRSRGYQLAREAVALVPYSADARNLELVYRLDMSSRDLYQPGKWRPVADEFAQAAALGPGKKYILDNLDSFYAGVLGAPGLAGETEAAAIRTRREQLALLRAH
ncbi:MAG TPA: hypothetical protein VLY04_16520 [Bryobacteraceae bacterium]|nr:hypothetical protein [Bryobacteraceae bacterium]